VAAAPPGGRLADSAPAKVNLYLLVTGRRPDGYHELDSLAVFAEVGDRLILEPAEALELTLAGPFGATLASEPDNLVLRAASAFATHAGRDPAFRFTLEKNLPVASGIGGGSADAASALRLLARMWGLALPERIASSLGADVPVCLAGVPTRMGGIGERLGPAPRLPACGIALANPGLPLATAAVFRARDGGFSLMADLPTAWPDIATLAADLRALGNDLEAAAIGLCPPIAEVLAALRSLPECRIARMSGSGPTCFGLFDDPSAAARAAAALARPGWWTWGGKLRGA
jgi:4-diphosphocytidyl-2-C-methyl-D-erythritol kinase